MSVDVSEQYPLHILVWNNSYHKLDEYLQNDKYDLELTDPHGRTPLTLAICLGHIEAARVLLRHNANVYAVDSHSWTVTHEAISTGDPELVKLCLAHRDGQRVSRQGQVAKILVDKIQQSSDFYLEMKWEFTSWLPVLSKMCPSDVCRVWKKGSNIRIDTTLLGMAENSTWLKGNLSYIFRSSPDGAVLDEVNHSQAMIYRHQIKSSKSDNQFNYLNQSPSDEFVARKLIQPIFVTYLETSKVEFEKSRSGFFSWLSDRKEEVNGKLCKVYSASNIEVVTLRRTEHLTEDDKKKLTSRSSSGSGGLASLLSAAGATSKDLPSTKLIKDEQNDPYNPWSLTMERYFSSGAQPVRDIGRPKEMSSHIKRFKAHLWMNEETPLSLQSQILPIIDLMAEYNPHFKKLKDFIGLQLPSGFPLKIEIPLYHILNAQITFMNINGSDTAVNGVHWNDGGAADDAGRCEIDEKVFQTPVAYHLREEQTPGRSGGVDEEEQMLQMALQRSLQDFGTPEQIDGVERPKTLMTDAAGYYGEEDIMMQRAIAESLHDDDARLPNNLPLVRCQDDPTAPQLKTVLALSMREKERAERQREEEEQEMNRVLKLSLTEQ